MKALVLKQYGKFLIEEVPDPTPAPDEVLIQVKACGICGSDVHGMDGSTGRRQPPVIMGHEAAGVIADVGSAVSGWRKGDRVTFDSTVYCGGCGPCRAGRINLCDHRMVLGVSCDDYRRDGAFAEYAAVPARILYALPDAVTFEQAAMVEALSIAVHAAGRPRISLGDTALAVGAGMIGLLVVQAIRNTGCGRIVAVDVDEAKLTMARRLGADATVNAADPDAREKIAEATGGGADVAFEVVGATEPVRTAVSGVKKGGSVVLVGNISKSVDLPLQEIVTREITLYGSCASSGEYPVCLDLIGRGRVDVDALISNTSPLSEGAEWFNRLYRKEPGLMKVILQPGK